MRRRRGAAARQGLSARHLTSKVLATTCPDATTNNYASVFYALQAELDRTSYTVDDGARVGLKFYFLGACEHIAVVRYRASAVTYSDDHKSGPLRGQRNSMTAQRAV